MLHLESKTYSNRLDMERRSSHPKSYLLREVFELMLLDSASYPSNKGKKNLSQSETELIASA